MRARNPEYVRRFKIAAKTAKWAVTMSKVRIRQAAEKAPFPRWHLLTFPGSAGKESRGVVDMIAIRKDHGSPINGTKRGDTFQIILVQVKGGNAAKPTLEDATRLLQAARHHKASGILLGSWKKGTAAKFFTLHRRSKRWLEVKDLSIFFGKAERIPND